MYHYYVRNISILEDVSEPNMYTNYVQTTSLDDEVDETEKDTEVYTEINNPIINSNRIQTVNTLCASNNTSETHDLTVPPEEALNILVFKITINNSCTIADNNGSNIPHHTNLNSTDNLPENALGRGLS